MTSEAASTRADNALMRTELDALKQQMRASAAASAEALSREVTARERADRDGEVLRDRLSLVLSMAGSGTLPDESTDSR